MSTDNGPDMALQCCITGTEVRQTGGSIDNLSIKLYEKCACKSCIVKLKELKTSLEDIACFRRYL